MALRLDSALLETLACPACHANLSVDYDAREMVCNSARCGLAYPIRDNIPIMMVEEARHPRSNREAR